MTKILPTTADATLSVHVLEGIAHGQPFRDTAAMILRDLEKRIPRGTACVLKADDRQGTARLAAAPSLPVGTATALERGLSLHHCTFYQAALQHPEGIRLDVRNRARASIHDAWHPALEHVAATACWVLPLRDDDRTLGILVVLGAPRDTDEEHKMRVETAPTARLLRAALQHDTRVEALQEREERFRQVTETMQEVFWLRTADEVLYISPSFETVWGRPREDLYTNPDAYLDDIHPDDYEHVREACNFMLRDHEALDLTYRIIRRRGDQRWVHVRFRPVQGRFPETRFAGILRDVTERVRQQRELREAKQLAEDADRLKSAMLANMSHEIRTPLTAVIGFAEVLREEADSDQQHIARLVHDSSRRLMRTLDSVLQLSKLEAGLVELNVGTVHLDEEVREAVQLHRPQAEAKEVALELDVRVEGPVVGRWDVGALHRIVDNLLSNAIKFTKPGGTTRLAIRQTDSEVHLLVEDTGIGIDADFLPHIFEPFKQESAGMRRSHEGSGLGLAIVRRLVEMMDGSIEVESEKNVGTTFSVALPFSCT